MIACACSELLKLKNCLSCGLGVDAHAHAHRADKRNVVKITETQGQESSLNLFNVHFHVKCLSFQMWTIYVKIWTKLNNTTDKKDVPNFLFFLIVLGHYQNLFV